MLTIRRVYLYAMALVGLGVLAVVVQGLLDVGFRSIGLPDGPVWKVGPTSREQISLAVALVVVGLPIWLIHWAFAERAVRADRGGAGERGAAIRAL